MHVWALGLSCETSAALGASNTTNIPREDTQKETKRAKMVAGEGKQREILGPHPSGHFFWVWAHPSGPPSPPPLLPLSRPHHDTHQIQSWIGFGPNWIDQNWLWPKLAGPKLVWPKRDWPKLVSSVVREEQSPGNPNICPKQFSGPKH